MERAYLEASQTAADTDLRAARQRAAHEIAARHRTRRLAIGLAAALVVAFTAAGLATRYQRDATARASDATAAGTLADANRLAALSTTVGSLDLSLLLAAAAEQIADTPETRDGLLTALLEHRRATRVVRLGGPAVDTALGDRGRTLFVDRGQDIVSWPVGSAEPAHVVDWYAPINIDASPTDDRVAVMGYVNGEARTGVFTADGHRELLVDADAMGGAPRQVAFSADGKRLLFVVANSVAGGWEGSLREVELEGGTARTVASAVDNSADPDVFIDGDFTDDASAVVVWMGETGGRATLVDLRDGSRTRLKLDRRPVDSLRFVALPTGVAQLWADGTVTVYDRSGHQVQGLDVHQDPVLDVLMSRDHSRAATTSADGTAVLWDVDTATGQWVHRETLTGHDGAVTGAELDPSGRRLFTGSQDQSVITWDVTRETGFGSSYPGLGDRWISNRPELVNPGLLVAPTRPVSRSGDGDTNPARDTVSVAATFLDPTTGDVVDQVTVGDTIGGSLFGSSVAVSPDRRMVAVTSGFATTVLDTRTREVLGQVALPPTGGPGPFGEPLAHELVSGAGWTPDGMLLLGTEGRLDDELDGGLVVVDATTWTPQRRVALGGSVQVMEPSPDGRVLAVASSEPGPDVVWILDAATLDKQQTLRPGDNDGALDLSFSPDGHRLAVGGVLGLLHVFDTTTWQRAQRPVKVHDQFIQQVEWMSDGKTVATSGADATVALYDSGRDLVRAVPLPASSETDVSGNLQQGYTHLVPGITDEIIALSGERSGRRYPLDPSEWLSEACDIAGRDLTRDEWARYLPDRPYGPTCGDPS